MQANLRDREIAAIGKILTLASSSSGEQHVTKFSIDLCIYLHLTVVGFSVICRH